MKDDFPMITFQDEKWLTSSEVCQFVQAVLAGVGVLALAGLFVWWVV